MRYNLDSKLASRRRPFLSRRGQALVEFAIVSFVLYFLFAGILTFGHLLYCAQSLQPAADVAASELARVPLPATASFYDALYSPDPAYSQVRSQVFDSQYLRRNLNSIPAGETLADWVKTWPIVNQMLVPLMIVDTDDVGDQFLWYPGAVQGTDSSGRSVSCIALVTGRQASGAENIEWAPVIEQAEQPDATTGFDAFNVQSSYRGLVALKINYPYQSATMSAYPAQTTWPPQPNGPAIQAQDGSVTVVSNPIGFTPSSGDGGSLDPTYSGPYGLGGQQAWLTTVRPFRRTISAQAVARREVFQ